MPTATGQRGICNSCNNSRDRADMSIFAGICNSCRVTHYVLCADCGASLRWSPAHRRRNNVGHYQGGEVYIIDNEFYCHGCCNDRTNSGNCWLSKPFDQSFATYQRILSKRKFGVEIETSRCADSADLRGRTNFGCKRDPTVSGFEFDSPILYGDEGLDYIRKFLDFADNHGWETDRHCGCHTHYDMRGESDEQLYRVAYAYAETYKLWRRCVPQSRSDAYYCERPEYTVRDIRVASQCESFDDFASCCERYNYVNLYAYDCHRTFEVRLLEGTVDAETICNWITIHCRFIDAAKKLSFDELSEMFHARHTVQFRALVSLIDDTDLTDWLANRARRIGHRPLRGPGSVNGSSPVRSAHSRGRAEIFS